ncbi:MAG: glycosyltransferase family 4 protein [Hyphomicrobiaceae bacterium]|nr:glycosyltransferase family 4 protein [Hyphomicrobiaceae bacterium]
MSGVTLVLVSAALLAASFAATSALIRASMPLLRRYALARPNARSSHVEPTPQGAGMAVIIPAVIVLSLMPLAPALGWANPYPGAPLVAISLVLLAIVGAIDDIRPLPAIVRLPFHLLAAGLIVASLPSDMRALPLLPAWLETVILVLGLVWFINLTNFMDGIDGITVAEFLPLSLLIVVIATLTAAKSVGAALPAAVALAGGLAGFMPYNMHPARVFLGDVGSLPIGALGGWFLIVVAAEVSLAAALILPLYYLADATLTLYQRWQRCERLYEAHRSHAYQRAIRAGFTVPEVSGAVLALNCGLAVLALAAVESASAAIDILALTVGAVLTAALIHHFERGKAT